MKNNQPPVTENNDLAGTENTDPQKGQEKVPVKKKKLSTQQIILIILIGLVILLPLSTYWVMDLQISKLKVRQGVEMDSLKNQTSAMINDNNRTNLQTVAKIFSWATRTEVMHNNLDQLNQIMVDLVKIKGYRQVVVLSDNGAVLLSTDKKYEGKEYTANFYQQLAGSDQLKLSVQKNGDLLVAAPVFGIDKRLGSVVITYTPPTPEFKKIVPKEDPKSEE